MSQQITMIGSTTIWSDSTKYKINAAEYSGSVIDIVRLSDSKRIIQIVDNVIVFFDITTLAAPVSYLGGIRLNLT